MTAEQLSSHLAQSADRSTFCADEPPAQTFNMEMTDTSQVRQSRPQQSYCDEYQETSTLPSTEHQTIQYSAQASYLAVFVESGTRKLRKVVESRTKFLLMLSVSWIPANPTQPPQLYNS